MLEGQPQGLWLCWGPTWRAQLALKKAPVQLAKSHGPVPKLRIWGLGLEGCVWDVQKHGMGLSFLPVSWEPEPVKSHCCEHLRSSSSRSLPGPLVRGAGGIDPSAPVICN